MYLHRYIYLYLLGKSTNMTVISIKSYYNLVYEIHVFSKKLIISCKNRDVCE